MSNGWVRVGPSTTTWTAVTPAAAATWTAPAGATATPWTAGPGASAASYAAVSVGTTPTAWGQMVASTFTPDPTGTALHFTLTASEDAPLYTVEDDPLGIPPDSGFTNV